MIYPQMTQIYADEIKLFCYEEVMWYLKLQDTWGQSKNSRGVFTLTPGFFRHAGLDPASSVILCRLLFPRHAGLDPASSKILCRPEGDSLSHWIPVYTGMGAVVITCIKS